MAWGNGPRLRSGANVHHSASAASNSQRRSAVASVISSFIRGSLVRDGEVTSARQADTLSGTISISYFQASLGEPFLLASRRGIVGIGSIVALERGDLGESDPCHRRCRLHRDARRWPATGGRPRGAGAG